MTAKVRKWGNSQALRVSKRLLEDAHLSVGDEVDLIVRDGTIIVRPLRRVRGKHDLRKLVARIPRSHRPKELGWGPPTGKEAW
ncbi:MAG: AbrB/MazE/SpoVT family DNA-binding domain-containing protein [Planctomycetota bacterium]|nr:AbrB/MazE/SpoVT family DNA-binding domain-containing protein [Planctomycetota bacterium]